MLVKTKSGFEIEIDKDSFTDDWELLELMVQADAGDQAATIKVLKTILGKDGYQALKEHLRVDGKVSATRMKSEFLEILTALGGNEKN